jgi:hypothetical protein
VLKNPTVGFKRQNSFRTFSASRQSVWRFPCFYKRLNEKLEQGAIDRFCEARCQEVYHENLGRLLWLRACVSFDDDRLLRALRATRLLIRQRRASFSQIGLDAGGRNTRPRRGPADWSARPAHQQVFEWMKRLVGGVAPREKLPDSLRIGD